jgi:hypothetical protein
MAKDSNLFLQIFKDSWDLFKQIKPAYSIEYYESVVSKIIKCGDVNEGYIKFECDYCGEDELTIGFSCKHSFCLKCGTIKAMQFVEEIKAKMFDDVTYKHLTLTMAEDFWTTFYRHRKTNDLFNNLYKAAWEFIQALFKYITKLKKIRAGAIMVIHVSGRDSSYNVHLHIILPMGVVDEISGKWVDISWVEYSDLHLGWKKYFFKMMEEYFANDPEFLKKIKEIKNRYPKGIVANLDPRTLPKGGGKLSSYLAKYLFRPSISVNRIIKYDVKKGQVTYDYSDHKTNRIQRETISVIDFIGRMVQQIMPKGFQRVRYFGLHGTSCGLKSKIKVIRGLERRDGIEPDPDREIELKRAQRLSFRERVILIRKKDPLRCKKCNRVMELVKVWTKSKGTIFNYYEKLANAPPIINFKINKQENISKIEGPSMVQMDFFSL